MKSPPPITSPAASGTPGGVSHGERTADGWMRHPATRASRWLRVDPRGAARFELRERHRSANRTGVDLRRGISRWRRALARRRALALLRRYALLGVAAALLMAIGIGLAGGDRRTWWLLAPLAVALVGAGIAVSRRVTVAQTAELFDAGLGLRNRVATAVELSQDKRGASREGTAGARASSELAARVTGEASTAVAESFGTVRLRGVGAPLEWLALAAVALALALLLVLAPAAPLPGQTHAGAGKHSPGAQTGAHRQGRRGHAGARPGTPRRATSPPPLALATHHQLGLFNNPYIPKLVAEGLAKALRNQAAAGAKHQGTKDFKTLHASGPNGVAGQPGLAGGKPSKSSEESLPSQLPSHGGGGLGAPGKGSQQGATQPASGANRAGSGAGAHGGLSKSPGSSPGANGSQHGAGAHASPGGDEAGSAVGNAALGLGLAPDLPHGSVGLPLQAGYAPSLKKHGSQSEGTSQTPNGNGHGGRTAQSYSAGGGGAGFAVIPPSSNASPAASQTQRDNYFGVANQLPLKSWR